MRAKQTLRDLVCDTSVIQYLYQIELLHVLPSISTVVRIPAAFLDELNAGITRGVVLPDVQTISWVQVCGADYFHKVLDASGLGAGEREVLKCAIINIQETVAALDDRMGSQNGYETGYTVHWHLGIISPRKAGRDYPGGRSQSRKVNENRFSNFCQGNGFDAKGSRRIIRS